jgi:hypothetical protein
MSNQGLQGYLQHQNVTKESMDECRNIYIKEGSKWAGIWTALSSLGTYATWRAGMEICRDLERVGIFPSFAIASPATNAKKLGFLQHQVVFPSTSDPNTRCSLLPVRLNTLPLCHTSNFRRYLPCREATHGTLFNIAFEEVGLVCAPENATRMELTRLLGYCAAAGTCAFYVAGENASHDCTMAQKTALLAARGEAEKKYSIFGEEK